jgi:hypothetical protein
MTAHSFLRDSKAGEALEPAISDSDPDPAFIAQAILLLGTRLSDLSD